MQYAGKILPSRKHYARDEYGRQRLPDSSRAADADGMAAAGWKTLQHSTSVTVTHARPEQSYGDTMRRLNKMFSVVKAEDMPIATRGRAGKDHSADPVFQALKAMPVGADWHTDGKEYSEDNARKFQSRIAAYAKAGAGTFSTSFRNGKVYIRKNAAEYTKQRGE